MTWGRAKRGLIIVLGHSLAQHGVGEGHDGLAVGGPGLLAVVDLLARPSRLTALPIISSASLRERPSSTLAKMQEGHL